MAKIAGIVGVVTAACAALGAATFWLAALVLPGHPLPAQGWVWGAAGLDALLLFAILERRAPVFGRIFSRGRRDEPLVALTFDDGPTEPWTAEILDILRRADVHATFFLIGRQALRAPALVRRMADEGHEIGNHTFDHVVVPLMAPARIRAQIRLASDAIARAAGVRPTLFRAPHGWRSPFLGRAARLEGCRPVAWTLGVWDTDRPGAEVIRQRVVRGLSNGCVVLLHDGRGTDDRPDVGQLAAALPGIIADARARGFRFVTLGQLVARASP